MMTRFMRLPFGPMVRGWQTARIGLARVRVRRLIGRYYLVKVVLD